MCGTIRTFNQTKHKIIKTIRYICNVTTFWLHIPSTFVVVPSVYTIYARTKQKPTHALAHGFGLGFESSELLYVHALMVVPARAY